MARPKPETPRVMISLRVTPQFLTMIDQARGGQSRAEYLEGLALMGAYRSLTPARVSPTIRPRSGAALKPS
jgi:hypothetical protein